MIIIIIIIIISIIIIIIIDLHTCFVLKQSHLNLVPEVNQKALYNGWIFQEKTLVIKNV